MTTVGTYEAKTKFTSLLKRAEKGETIIIARHGVPVAKLLAAGTPPKRPVREVIAQMKEFARGRSLRGLSIKKMIEDGRA